MTRSCGGRRALGSRWRACGHLGTAAEQAGAASSARAAATAADSRWTAACRELPWRQDLDLGLGQKGEEAGPVGQLAANTWLHFAAESERGQTPTGAQVKKQAGQGRRAQVRRSRRGRRGGRGNGQLWKLEAPLHLICRITLIFPKTSNRSRFLAWGKSSGSPASRNVARGGTPCCHPTARKLIIT